MKIFKFYIPLVLFITSCSSKKLIFSEKNKKIYLQPNLKIDSTKLYVTRYDGDYPLNSQYEMLYKQNREIQFTMIGLGIRMILDFQEKGIDPKIELFSDYKQYDGKHIKILELETYKLVINKKALKKQDTVNGKLFCVSKANKHSKPLKVYGQFKHIVGTGKLVLKSGKEIILNKPFNK